MLTSSITLPTLPVPLTWEVAPAEWQVDPDHILHIMAAGDTDLFCDPEGQYQKYNAPRLVFPAPPQFTLSARMRVDFHTTYDAGVLLVYATDTSWAKLCFEFSPQERPMIVSVVTNGVSDDSNAVTLERREVFLRVTRLPQSFAFHYSLEGTSWQLVRYFALRETTTLRVGFSAQSPTGTSCTASFYDITYTPQRVRDIRSGE